MIVDYWAGIALSPVRFCYLQCNHSKDALGNHFLQVAFGPEVAYVVFVHW